MRHRGEQGCTNVRFSQATSVLLEDLVTGGENDGETSEEMTQAAVKVLSLRAAKHRAGCLNSRPCSGVCPQALVEKRPLVLEINRNINECLATVDAQVHGAMTGSTRRAETLRPRGPMPSPGR